jgi:Tfp pilus assembly protein PilV
MIALVLLVFVVLGLVALLRCRREDIPAIVRALASWCVGS